MMALLRQNLFEKFLAKQISDGDIEARLDDLVNHRTDPYTAVDSMIEESRSAPGKTLKSNS